MKLYAPGYYKRFRCIADKCEHSCCVGWEIDIDEAALKRYESLKSGYGALIADSVSTEDTPHFKLCDGDRCPHLDDRGLCKIILEVGEDYLCHICREHPRFYNYTDVTEVGLGLSCEEAARLILSSADYVSMEEIGIAEAVSDDVAFNGRAERDRIYAVLRNTALPYEKRLDEIAHAYAIDADGDQRRLAVLGSMEYLDEKHRALFATYSAERRPHGKDEYLERFLAYLIYRHCTEAFDEADFSVRLAFCLFCERLLASLICTERAESLQEIAVLARILSEEIEYSDENTSALTY